MGPSSCLPSRLWKLGVQQHEASCSYFLNRAVLASAPHFLLGNEFLISELRFTLDEMGVEAAKLNPQFLSQLPVMRPGCPDCESGVLSVQALGRDPEVWKNRGRAEGLF